jgi:hypothetical protein
MLDAGERRHIRRYAVSAISLGSLAVVLDGALVRLGRGAPAAASAAADADGSLTAASEAADATEELGPGSVLHDEGLVAFLGGERSRASPFRALAPSTLLVLAPHKIAALREAGHLAKPAAAAQFAVCARHLRRLAFFTTLDDDVLAELATFILIRVAGAGEPATPPESPQALVFVAHGAVAVASDGGSSSQTEVRHTSARCWVNEADFIGRKPPASAAPTVLQPSTLLVVLPENFIDLRVALPTFAATAGSSTLLAMRESLLSASTAQKHPRRRDESLVTARQRSAEEVEAAVILRWERLTVKLLPDREGVHSTFSLAVSDYRPPHKAREVDAPEARLAASLPRSARQLAAARDAARWREANRIREVR